MVNKMGIFEIHSPKKHITCIYNNTFHDLGTPKHILMYYQDQNIRNTKNHSFPLPHMPKSNFQSTHITNICKFNTRSNISNTWIKKKNKLQKLNIKSQAKKKN